MTTTPDIDHTPRTERIFLVLDKEEREMWELVKDMIQQPNDTKAFSLFLKKLWFDAKLAQGLANLQFMETNPSVIPKKYRKEAEQLADKHLNMKHLEVTKK